MSDDFPTIFAKLKAILQKYEKTCLVDKDTESDYYLNSKRVDAKNKPIFFAAASANKSSVSFHLMPVYCHPELLEDISPELRKRLNGKSCFRFTKLEPELIEELAALTKRSVAKVRAGK